MSEQTMRRIVESLVLPRGRPVGSKGHDTARRYLVDQMTRAELQGYGPACGFELPFTVDGQGFCNLIGVLPGGQPSSEPMLIAAHYDTCYETPGADDNAAAVAVAMTAVEELRSMRLDRSVIFAFFDSEEPPWFLSPGMGSLHFYEHQRKEAIHFALVMDLVGHDVSVPGLEDLLFLTGMESDPGLAAVVKDCHETKGIRVVATLNRYVGDLSDHHAFRLDRRPYLFLSCGHWEHYHAPTDTAEKLNYSKMRSIRDFVTKAMAKADTSSLDGPFESYDSTPTEVSLMKIALGPHLARLGINLEGRSDVDKLVAALLSMGL